jgi:hypothetical protein
MTKQQINSNTKIIITNTDRLMPFYPKKERYKSSCVKPLRLLQEEMCGFIVDDT